MKELIEKLDEHISTCKTEIAIHEKRIVEGKSWFPDILESRIETLSGQLILLEQLREIAVAEQKRVCEEIAMYAHTNAINDYNEGFHAATERAKKILKGEV